LGHQFRGNVEFCSDSPEAADDPASGQSAAKGVGLIDTRFAISAYGKRDVVAERAIRSNDGWYVATGRDPPANQTPLNQSTDCGRARGDLAGDCLGAVAAIDRLHSESLALDAEPRGPTQRRADTLSSRRGGQASLEEGTASETMPAGVPSPTAPARGREAARGLGATTDHGLAAAGRILEMSSTECRTRRSIAACSSRPAGLSRSRESNERR
jgi:hypothetical protein